MGDKKYSALEVTQELMKSLHRAIAKADPVLRNILADLEDQNAEADVPQDEIPKATPQSVLYKQQQNQPPKIKAVGAQVADAPKNMVSPNINQMAINKQPAIPKAPKGPEGLSMPKSEGNQQQINLSGMGKLKDFLHKRNNSQYVKDGAGVNLPINASDDKEASEKSLQGIQVRRGDLKGAVETAKDTLFEAKRAPKPDLPKSETAMAKSEYTPFEVAVEVLKKAESMLKAKKIDWDDHKIEENKMVDPSLHEERQIANQNDIDNEFKQQLTNTSKKRLNDFLAKRKAKKVKDL
jgi:hypothetical protein